MKSENLHHPNQSSYTSENICLEINGADSTQHIRHMIPDHHKMEEERHFSERSTEKERHMPLSPTPKKHARIERGTSDCEVRRKKEGKESRPVCSEFKVGTSQESSHIKSEIGDDWDKVHIKQESSAQIDTSNVHRSSLHSTTPYFFHGSGIDSTESSTTLSPSSSTCQDRGNTRRHSITPELMSTSTDDLEDTVHDQPDSSTGTYENLTREVIHRLNVSEVTASTSQSTTTASSTKCETALCQVCGDLAAGFYCGAYICEACKKFFIRASKLQQPRYVCLRSKHCTITKESRVHCQYCRYQKCLQLNMYHPNDGQKHFSQTGVQKIPCRVCSAPSSGFHFGALTCEGCKGFFRRMVKEREAYSYKCSRDGKCEVNAMTRNMCKACRYHKCLQIGMSVEGSRIGRQPNAVKHAISLEASKQVALKVDSGIDNEANTDSNPSHISFDSVILDHCIPGEVDDNLKSIDLTHVSSSLDVHKPTLRMLEKDSPEPETLLPYCQVNQVLYGTTEEQISSAMPIDHSDIYKHQITQSPSHKLHNSYSSLNPSSVPASIPRNFKPQIFGRPQIEVPDCSFDNQPQDLSIDLSKPRTLTTSSGKTTHQNALPVSSDLPWSSCGNTHPVSAVPYSSFNYPTDYPHQVEHNFQSPYLICSFADQDRQCGSGYNQTMESYGENTVAFNIDTHNSYHKSSHNSTCLPQQDTLNSYHKSSHNSTCLPQQDTFFNRMYTQTQALEGQFSSLFQESNRPHYIDHQHHQVSYCHQLGSEPQQQFAPSSRPNSMNEIHPHPPDHQEYAPHLEGGDIYTGSSDLHSFQGRSSQLPEPHNHMSSKQQWPPFPPSTLSQPSCYVLPNFHPPSASSAAALCPSKEPRLMQTSLPNNNNQVPSNPTPVPGMVTASKNQSCLNMSNQELHGVLLEAATNLANFCAVSRAKSDIFEADRFKDVDSTWEKMMEHFNFHAKYIVRFARRVPGFRSLKIDDQVLLLRMATYSLVILNHSRAYEPDTGFYNYFNFNKKEIQMIRELFPEFDVIHGHYEHIGIMAQRHSLTEMEYAYLSCILLLNDEYSGLENAGRTKELKDSYMDAFQDYEIENFPNDSLRFDDILQHMSKFSQFNIQHNVAVGLVITKNPQLHISQLYAEMYTQNNSPQDNTDNRTDENVKVGEFIKQSTA